MQQRTIMPQRACGCRLWRHRTTTCLKVKGGSRSCNFRPGCHPSRHPWPQIVQLPPRVPSFTPPLAPDRATSAPGAILHATPGPRSCNFRPGSHPSRHPWPQIVQLPPRVPPFAPPLAPIHAICQKWIVFIANDAIICYDGKNFDYQSIVWCGCWMQDVANLKSSRRNLTCKL